ncbi:MAG: MFS transporter [Gammaproteobacteria bacterium]|jgi:DHA1 family bicyclomycin/chloramphenicol resistance-like MFS transporter
MRAKKPSNLLLGVASGISPFGMAIAIPTIESFAQLYQAPYSTVQFIISAYLLGLASSMPLVGFLSDKIGRRPVLISGLILFVIASIFCSTTDSLNSLIFWRVIQGIGASVGSVMARAMIRDVSNASETARSLSRVTAIMGISPMIAPVIGGIGYQIFGNPNGIFIITAAIGILVLTAILLLLPETRNAALVESTSKEPWSDKYRYLLGSKVFVGSSLIYAFTTGAFFAILAVASTVFYNDLGIDSAGFGFIWSGLTILYTVSAFMAGTLSSKYGLMKVLLFGVLLNVIAGLLFYSLVKVFDVTLISVIVPLVIMFFAHGYIVPMSLAQAVSARPEIAGSSSGLSSALGLVIGGMFSVLSGLVFDGRLLPIALIVSASTILCGLSYFMVLSGKRKNTA